MYTIEYYLSNEFIIKIKEIGTCGEHAWVRLMSWANVDNDFHKFLSFWCKSLAKTFHNTKVGIIKENLNLDLSSYFENLYSAYFIFRMYQIADTEKKQWIKNGLNSDQQSILQSWFIDSEIDIKKAMIVDNWQESLPKSSVMHNGINIFNPISTEIFNSLSNKININTRKAR